MTPGSSVGGMNRYGGILLAEPLMRQAAGRARLALQGPSWLVGLGVLTVVPLVHLGWPGGVA